MTNLMHKLFKNKSTQRLIVSYKSPQHQEKLPKFTPSLITPNNHTFSLTKSDLLNNPSVFLIPKSPKNDNFTESLKFYPNFPFGYLLNPIGPTGFDPLMEMVIEEGTTETEEDWDDGAGKFWADSVKKKRKKKMNKHKYKKLRKRLRRKT